MFTKKIYDENGKGFTRVFANDKVERVNPIEFYTTFEIERRSIALRDLLSAKNPYLAQLLDDEFFIKKATSMLDGFFEKFENTEIHQNLIELLKTKKKRKQINLLKGVSLNPDQLMKLIFVSYKDFGYIYSRYTFENLPRGYEDRKLPKLFRLKENDEIEKVGETDLTDGELKNIILQRKVIVSHFFEKDDLWHCFFLTFNSIGGRENHKGGQPHFHYISSSFLITKDDFIESMKNGKYKSTSVHIDLLEYGKQPSTD